MNSEQLNPDIYVSTKELMRLQFKAHGFSFLPNQPVTSALNGKNVSKLRGRGLNFEELRHYRPGDDIRAMDWKVTQRTGKPHVKVFTEEKERNIFIAVDQRSSMFFGSTHKMKSVVAAEIASLIAWQVSQGGDRIGSLVFNDGLSKLIPAKRGKQQVIGILSEITKQNHALEAGITDENTSDSLIAMLKQLNQVVKHNALVILISDGSGWNEQSTTLLKKIRQHNEIVTCRVFDPLEENLPQISQMVVSDGKSQIQFSASNTEIQQKFSDTIKQQIENYQTIMNKYRIPFFSIDTTKPATEQLQRALGKVST